MAKWREGSETADTAALSFVSGDENMRAIKQRQSSEDWVWAAIRDEAALDSDQEPVLAEPEAFIDSGWFSLDDLPEPMFHAMRYALNSYGTGQHYFPGT